MHNAEYRFDGNKLIITIDVSRGAFERARAASETGKTLHVATSHGAVALNVPIDGGKAYRSAELRVSLNVKRGFGYQVTGNGLTGRVGDGTVEGHNAAIVKAMRDSGAA